MSDIKLHVLKLDENTVIDEEEMGHLQALSLCDSLAKLHRSDPEACQRLLASILMEAGEFTAKMGKHLCEMAEKRQRDDGIEQQLVLRKAQHDFACGLIVMGYAATQGDFAKMAKQMGEAMGEKLREHPFYKPHLDAHMEAAIDAGKKRR